MLSGVGGQFPRQIVAPASSTTHIEVCSRDTSSPTYCCCFMVVLRFVTTEALMLQAMAPAITVCPDLPLGRAPRAAAVKEAAATAASAEPAQSVLDRASTVLPLPWRNCTTTGSRGGTAPLFSLDHWWEVLFLRPTAGKTRIRE